VDPATCETRLEDLRALVGPATKLVAVVHVSNILGEVARFVIELTSEYMLPPN
jgi:selenocysteine lyase/cysteine desulfurase